MKHTHIANGDRTICGLRLSPTRQLVIENPTCCGCLPPKRYTDHAELAKTIYQGTTTFLQECLVEGKPGVVYFNSKSREKKHVVLVQEDGAWRRRRPDERASVKPGTTVPAVVPQDDSGG